MGDTRGLDNGSFKLCEVGSFLFELPLGIYFMLGVLEFGVRGCRL